MAISRNNAGGNASFHSAGTNTSLNPVITGASLKVGDRLLAMISSTATNPTVTSIPSGWTQVGSLYKPTTTLASAIYYRDYLVDDDLDQTATFTWSAAGRMIAMITAYSGVDLTVPPLLTNSNATVASTTFNTPAITLADGDWLVSLITSRQSPGNSNALEWSLNVPTDFEVYQIASAITGTNPRVAGSFSDSAQAMPAGSANRTFTNDSSMAEAHMYSVRMRAPAGAAGYVVGMPIR